MPDYQSIKRTFSKDDLDMMEQAQVFHDSFIVDKADFIAAFPKFADPYAADFQAEIITTDAIPGDAEVQQEIAIKTEQLEAQMVLGRKALQKLFTYVKVAFDGSQAMLKVFGKGEYEKARSNQMRMKELLEKANRQGEVAAYKAALIAAGFLQADITNLQTLSLTIATLNQEQEDLKTSRLLKTELRIIALNKVWAYMVEISEASKVVFEDSPAKLAEYSLYPGGSELPYKVQNLAYTLLTNTVSWDVAVRAETYELEYKIDNPAAEWILAYEGVNIETVHNPGVGNWLYRCRGKNGSGGGEWSDELAVTI